MKTKIAELAFALCSIPSISDDEYACLKFVKQKLLALGFIVETLDINGSPDRFNLLAYFIKPKKFLSILCTHLDTVAPHIEPSFDIKKEILWGRGSCDAKGIAAAMIFTAVEQHRAGFDDIALLFTVGEEKASDGAKACKNKLAGSSSFLIVGEPTKNICASGQKGSVVFDIVAHGVEAHSSMPYLGDSAIHKIVNCMSSLLNLSWPKNSDFGETLINFGEITGGQARNMLANSAKTTGIVRVSCKPAQIINLIKSKLTTGIELIIHSECEPFRYFVPENCPSFCAGFGSDAPYLSGLGEPILLGPGNLELAHRENEHVLIEDLHQGFLYYQKIINQLRGMKQHE